MPKSMLARAGHTKGDQFNSMERCALTFKINNLCAMGAGAKCVHLLAKKGPYNNNARIELNSQTAWYCFGRAETQIPVCKHTQRTKCWVCYGECKIQMQNGAAYLHQLQETQTNTWFTKLLCVLWLFPNDKLEAQTWNEICLVGFSMQRDMY